MSPVFSSNAPFRFSGMPPEPLLGSGEALQSGCHAEIWFDPGETRTLRSGSEFAKGRIGFVRETLNRVEEFR